MPTQAGSHDWDYPTGARMASRIGDPAVRGDAQDYLKKQWQASDAAAANAWEKTLPIDDQKRLQPPTK